MTKLNDICLSGFGGSGEVYIESMCVETYGPGEKPGIEEEEDEADPGVPDGEFVEFTDAFPELNPRIGIGEDEHPIKLGNGDVVVGGRSQNVIADLSDYTKLTIVTSPNLKLVLYMNHEIEAKQNPGDYTEEEAGLYVCQDLQADENGIIEVDLTEFDKADLNGICLPWDNSNRGTVWYILLTEGEKDPLKPYKKDLQDAIAKYGAVNKIGKTEESISALAQAIGDGLEYLEDDNVTEQDLASATSAIEQAYLALQYEAGYAPLTREMFMSWADEAGGPVVIGCDVNVGVSTGLTYGDPSVIYTNYADLTDFETLYISVLNGTPRVILNRVEPIDPEEEGYDAHGGAYTQFTDAADEEGLVTIDLTAIVEEDGVAHLNAIKGANGQNVTVGDMLVYAPVSKVYVDEVGYTTFSSIMNVTLTGVTGYYAAYNGQTASVDLFEVGVVPANEAVIIKAPAGVYSLQNCRANSVTNNYFLGATSKDSFETSDLNEYVASRPSSITVPNTIDVGGTELFTAWIYPESWGRPTSAISSLSHAEEVQSFNYGELGVPSGYIGMWVDATSECTYTLTWPIAGEDPFNELIISDGKVVGDASTIYVLADGVNGIGFYLLNEDETVPAGKAYMAIVDENVEEVRPFISITGETTGISTVAASKQNKVEVFNLAGQRVSKAQKGIIIQNGKKVVR